MNHKINQVIVLIVLMTLIVGCAGQRVKPQKKIQVGRFDFSFGQDDLAQSKRLQLQMQFQQIRSGVIVIEGHADPVGSLDQNDDLSDRRAQAIKQELVKLGWPESSLVTVSYGERPQGEPTAQKKRVVILQNVQN